jgi:hypothetical protein
MQFINILRQCAVYAYHFLATEQDRKHIYGLREHIYGPREHIYGLREHMYGLRNC